MILNNSQDLMFNKTQLNLLAGCGDKLSIEKKPKAKSALPN